MNDESVCGLGQQLESGDEFLQLIERKRSQFIAGSTMEGEFNDPAADAPRQRLTFELLHAWCGPFHRPLHYTACFTRYMSSISFCMRLEIRSRLSLPLAVSIPFSMEKGSERTQNARTCL